ncbi:hypothetical protein [Rhizobium sp. NPDC090279]
MLASDLNGDPGEGFSMSKAESDGAAVSDAMIDLPNTEANA